MLGHPNKLAVQELGAFRLFALQRLVALV